MSAHLFFWRRAVPVAIGFLFMSSAAYSQSRLQYDFVDVSYGQAEADNPSGFGGDLDADLIGISGSFAIAEQVFIQGGYGQIDFDDIFGLSADADEITVGVGWHEPVGTNTDVIFDINYLYVDVEVCGAGLCISDDDSGYSANAGLRSLMSNDKLELAGSVGYADSGSGSGEVGVAGSARYHFNDSFSGAILAGFGEDVTSYGVSFRLAW